MSQPVNIHIKQPKVAVRLHGAGPTGNFSTSSPPATAGTTLADADRLPFWYSATWVAKYITWANLKTALGGIWALLAHGHSGTTDGSKLIQANTHESADTDSATGSLHHTIGTGANNAAAGNHDHTWAESNEVLSNPYPINYSATVLIFSVSSAQTFTKGTGWPTFSTSAQMLFRLAIVGTPTITWTIVDRWVTPAPTTAGIYLVRLLWIGNAMHAEVLGTSTHQDLTTGVHGVGAGTIAKTSDIPGVATTAALGMAPLATAPGSGLRNILAIDNGETARTDKALFDATVPVVDGTAAAGSAMVAARRDHVHPTDTSRAATETPAANANVSGAAVTPDFAATRTLSWTCTGNVTSFALATNLPSQACSIIIIPSGFTLPANPPSTAYKGVWNTTGTRVRIVIEVAASGAQLWTADSLTVVA